MTLEHKPQGSQAHTESVASLAVLAPRSFWLDGGYDRVAVEACPYHPFHHWWIFRLGDVVDSRALRDPDEMMAICRGCYVPRCGHTTEVNPCLLPRHHTESHWTAEWAESNE